MAEYLQPTPANKAENVRNGTEVQADRPVSLSESQNILYDTNHRIELVPVSRLAPYKGNARTHSRKQIRQIADSIRRFGFTNPVLIDNGGEIIAGHGRVAAAKLLGLNEVPASRRLTGETVAGVTSLPITSLQKKRAGTANSWRSNCRA